MHIASAISVLDEDFPQNNSRKKRIPNVKDKQVHREAGNRVPDGQRRVSPRRSPIQAARWLAAEVTETGRPT